MAIKPNKLRVAIVHDWLTNLGGAERVVEVLHNMYPEAPIYTSVYRPEKLPLLQGATIIPSFLQHWPLAKQKHQLYPLLRTRAFESFDFSDYDLVISSSSAEAKGVITSTETIHISYIHTPTRYYWSGYKQYLQDPGLGIFNPIAKFMLPKLVKKMRRWDYAAAGRPDVLVANSQTVAKRIKQYYNRDSQVIYPPIDTKRFDVKKTTATGYFLVVSRLIPYKRVDLAVRACSDLGKKLVVIGTGSEQKKLRKLAGPTVEFKGQLSDKETTRYFEDCKAFIFTAEEDFGITPVEAMAAGKPVIYLNRAGASETVQNDKTGVGFLKQDVESVKAAIEAFEHKNFSAESCRARAQEFDTKVFEQKINRLVRDLIEQKEP